MGEETRGRDVVAETVGGGNRIAETGGGEIELRKIERWRREMQEEPHSHFHCNGAPAPSWTEHVPG